MHSIRTTLRSTSEATEAIFNACRANPKREARNGVTFMKHWEGTEYEATLRNAEGVVVAIATIDQYDI